MNRPRPSSGPVPGDLYGRTYADLDRWLKQQGSSLYKFCNELLGVGEQKSRNFHEEILRLAASGAPRPKRGSDRHERALANAVDRLTGRVTGPSFDAALRAECERLAPHWYANTADVRKKRFLAAARQGEPKPCWKTQRKDAELLALYLKPSSKVYDPQFAADLRAVNLDWICTIYTRANDKKTTLLEMAQRGDPKPTAWSKQPSRLRQLGRALRRYVQVSQEEYDHTFHCKLVQIGGWRLPALPTEKERARWIRIHRMRNRKRAA